MAYQLAWNIPQKILRLDLSEDVSLADFLEINRLMTDYLKEKQSRIAIVVDASNLKIAPYGIEPIRVTQTYLRNQQIAYVLIVTGNKLTRLAMLLLFNLAGPSVQFFDNFDQVQRFMKVLVSKELMGRNLPAN